MKSILTVEQINQRILDSWPYFSAMEVLNRGKQTKVWGVPRGGWNIAFMLAQADLAKHVTTPEEADVIVDDIVDSGNTRKKYFAMFPHKAFWAPYDKTINPELPWLVFPWEGSAEQDGQELITRMLQMISEDPNREGLRDTPARVVRSWKELYAGYHQKAEEVLGTVFQSENRNMVLSRNIEFASMCEHHMLPFTGHVTIGYIPGGTVVGLSKLARLVDMYARRLQIQEQFTQQIAEAMAQHIPKIQGAAVVVTAKHSCMSCRGVGKQDSDMVTSALTGKFLEPVVRMEFVSLLRPFK